MRQFQATFGFSSNTRVLDIGGSLFNWSLIEETPSLTLLNLLPPRAPEGGIRIESYVIADGRYLPFKDEAFCIVYSNSVIEHLGHLEDQRLFARECQRVNSCGYYVQTPNKWFPIEPHLLTPFIHWFPKRIRKHLLRKFTVWGVLTRPSQEYCDKLINEIRLLDKQELKVLYSDARICEERILGLVKSFIAVRSK